VEDNSGNDKNVEERLARVEGETSVLSQVLINHLHSIDSKMQQLDSKMDSKMGELGSKMGELDTVKGRVDVLSALVVSLFVSFFCVILPGMMKLLSALQ